MLRSIGDARTRHGGELLYRALRLREQLEKLDPRRAGEGRADSSEAREDVAFGIG